MTLTLVGEPKALNTISEYEAWLKDVSTLPRLGIVQKGRRNHGSSDGEWREHIPRDGVVVWAEETKRMRWV